MSDVVFSTSPHTVETAPGSAELIYLRRALLVVRGMYFDPVTQSDQPLPPHRWVLYRCDTPSSPTPSGSSAAGMTNAKAAPKPPQPTPVYSESQDSDDGYATIFETEAMRGEDPDATWNLLMIPIFPGIANSNEYAAAEGAWIDVDRHEWVTDSDQRSDPLNTRRLLRFPMWSTQAKVALTGGFAEGNPNSVDFEITGLLKTRELTPHGSRAKPWRMQIDQGWFRSYVQFHYYDPVARKDAVFEQGLLVSDRTIRSRSTVRLDSKCVYVVHPCSKDQMAEEGGYYLTMSEGLAFSFKTPQVWEVAPSEQSDERRRGTHYDLPKYWTSTEAEAWDGPGEPTAPKRKTFASLRTHGTSPTTPICFHLDDLVLTNIKTDAIDISESRVTVFDGLLRIKAPASGPHGALPYSSVELKTFPLRAEDWYYVPGEGLEHITRAVECGGHLFVLRNRRAQRKFEGSRAVVIESPSPLDKAKIFLIDTTYLKTQVGQTSVRLAHLLCYIPCFVTTNSDDDVAGANPARAYLPLGEHLLLSSAEVWDQKHSAHADGNKKEYVLVPQRGLTEEAVALRIRYHFGARSKPEKLTIDGSSFDNTELRIEIHPVAGRATGGSPMHLFLRSGPKIYSDLTATEKKQHVTLSSDERPSFAPGTITVVDSTDGVEGSHFTVAHELGHEYGLGDEYAETNDWSELDELPVFFRLGEGKFPQNLLFALDSSAMMCRNGLLRLRYAWPLVQQFRDKYVKDASPDHWLRKNEPFVVEHTTPRQRIRYDLGKHTDPWAPSNTGRVGCSDVFLYPLSDDEGSLGPAFTDQGQIASPFDGALVIATKYWFSFTGGQDDKNQGKLIRRFGNPIYRPRSTSHFFIEGPPGASEFKRIALAVRPRFEVASHPSPNASAHDADLQVRVAEELQGPIVTFGPPPILDVGEDHINPYLTRVALQLTAPYDAEDLKPSDFELVNDWVASQLKRPKGTIKPF